MRGYLLSFNSKTTFASPALALRFLNRFFNEAKSLFSILPSRKVRLFPALEGLSCAFLQILCKIYHVDKLNAFFEHDVVIIIGKKVFDPMGLPEPAAFIK